MKLTSVLVALLIVSLMLAGCTGVQNPGKTSNTPASTVEPSSKDDMPPSPPNDDDKIADVSPKVSSGQKSAEEQTSKSFPKEFVDIWRLFSSRLFYDIGGAGAVSQTGSQLIIKEDGTWQLSSSSGTWSVADITSADWQKWNVSAYGPKRKIILSNWNKGSADGPVEESNGRVDFIWLIYRISPPAVSSAGQIQAKYGHSN